jgi:aldose 1-epimerase
VDEQTISLELGEPWPLGGRVTQRFELSDADLLISMTVEATQSMPVMLGWHPWFNRYLDGPQGRTEAQLTYGPCDMYELDDTAIPTGARITPPPGPWDNCFVALGREPVISWPGVIDLELTSSCDHWVIYTEPEHALCIEPQTDAPDVFNRTPTVLEAGESTTAWFRLRWS